MTYGLSAPVLVLNRSFHPVRVTTARQAFEMLYVGRVHALDRGFHEHDFTQWAALVAREDDEVLGTPSGLVRVPRLVLLATYNRIPQVSLRLSRRNVYLRDGHRCQYCGRMPSVDGLNLDHVVPHSRGGTHSWDNLVTSCRECNLRKGGALPHECGMTPLSPPARPRWTAAVQLQAAPRSFPEWEPFLGAASRAASGWG